MQPRLVDEGIVSANTWKIVSQTQHTQKPLLQKETEAPTLAYWTSIFIGVVQKSLLLHEHVSFDCIVNVWSLTLA